MRIKSVFKHSAQALAEGSLVALLVVGLMAGSVLAAKPEGSGQGKPGGGGGKPSGATGSFALVMVDRADTVVNWGDDVTFNVTSTATYTFVDVACYQAGTMVFQQAAGFYAGYPWSQIFSLDGYGWTGGAADCNAKLYYTDSSGQNPRTLATMSFYANP